MRNGEGASGTRRDRDIGLDQGDVIDLNVPMIVYDDQISRSANDSLDDHSAEFDRSDDNDIPAGHRFYPADTSGQAPLAWFQSRKHRTGPDHRHGDDSLSHHHADNDGPKDGRDPNDQHRTHEDDPFIRHWTAAAEVPTQS